jgi:hypothetical protein
MPDNNEQRSNQAFVADLRKEIFQSQERRGKLLIHKLSFVSGFFGIGAFEKLDEIKLGINTDYIFYIIPFIALIFDLYLMGEDYAVKRAGFFIKTSLVSPEVEKQWENFVEEGKRDYFSTWAYRITTILIVAFCVVMLEPKEKYTDVFFLAWAILCLLYIILHFVYRAIINKRLDIQPKKNNK